MKKIVALGMNAFQRKQIHEFQKIVDFGYAVDIFTNDFNRKSDNEVKKINGLVKHFTLEKTALKRLIQLAHYFIKEKNIEIANIYPGGRFAWIYLIFCKINKIKSVCVEWGNLSNWDTLDFVTKISLIVCYRYCDATWYKEPYMEEKIKKLGGKKLFFIHNCYSGKKESFIQKEIHYDFIWVNRIIPQRYIFWFVNGLKTNELNKTKNILIGYQNDLKENDPINLILENLILEKPNNLEILPFQEPFVFYRKSKFFVLPSSIVFGNNALIEAMSYGIIPIVTNSLGAELIVIDGYNGFVSENNEESFINKMIYAQSLSDEKLKSISENAIEFIKKNFSLEEWGRKIFSLYKNVLQ